MKLLVVKLSDIGDILTATPAIRALRRTFPRAHITCLVPPRSAEVLAGSSLVDDVLIFDKFRFDAPWGALNPYSLALGIGLFKKLRTERFDCVTILHHLTTRWGALKFAALALATGAPRRVGLDNGRGWFLTDKAPDRGFGYVHEVEHWLEVVKLLGAIPNNEGMEFTTLPDDEVFADEHLPPSGLLVALHPGSGEYSSARRWPPRYFAEVAHELIREYDAKIVLVGGTGEEKLAEEVAAGIGSPTVNITGMTTIRQLGAVLKRCHLFIGNDSGLMHLAVALGTPVVAIFGPSNPRAWGPWIPEAHDGRVARVVRLDLPCSPCLYVGRSLGKKQGCDEMTCLKMLPPQRVLEASRGILSHHGK